MDEQGLSGAVLFPTLGVGIEDALKHDPEACTKVFHAFNLWLEEDWGFAYEGRLFAAPYLPLLDAGRGGGASSRRVLDAGAVVVNVRSAPVPAPGGYRSPFDPQYDDFWGLAAEAGVVVATHAGIEGYDALVQMWEPGVAESSLFRSPLRNIVTKGRAVSDFYAAAVCHKVFETVPGASHGQRRERGDVGSRSAPRPRRRRQPQPELLPRSSEGGLRRARLGDAVLGGPRR